MILVPLLDATTSRCEGDIDHSRKQDMAFMTKLDYASTNVYYCVDEKTEHMLIIKMVLSQSVQRSIRQKELTHRVSMTVHSSVKLEKDQVMFLEGIDSLLEPTEADSFYLHDFKSSDQDSHLTSSRISFTVLTALTIQLNSQTLKPRRSQHPLQSQSSFVSESQRSSQMN
jgi:hypothetical protein